MTRLNNFLRSSFIAALLLGIMPSFSHAIGFDISWTGSNGWSMTGMFSYSDTLINMGAIDENDIDTLMIDVLLFGVSQGTWELADGTGGAGLNFNFDTNTNSFNVGGIANSPNGQIWGTSANPGVQFVSGFPSQGVNVDGIILSGLTPTNSSTLTATPKPTGIVPEPSTLLLVGTGMLGLLGYAALRKRQAQAAA